MNLFIDDKIDLSVVIRIKKINEDMMKDKIILLGNFLSIY